MHVYVMTHHPHVPFFHLENKKPSCKQQGNPAQSSKAILNLDLARPDVEIKVPSSYLLIEFNEPPMNKVRCNKLRP